MTEIVAPAARCLLPWPPLAALGSLSLRLSGCRPGPPLYLLGFCALFSFRSSD